MNKIIDKIIEAGFKVRFRPHPENLKRSMNILNHFYSNFYNDLMAFQYLNLIKSIVLHVLHLMGFL